MALLPDRIEEFEIFNEFSNGHKELNLNFYGPVKECFLGLEPRKYLTIAHEGDANLDIYGKKFWKLRTDALYARLQLVKDNVQFQLGTLAYSLTHSLTYSLTYLLTYLHAHSLTYLLTY